MCVYFCKGICISGFTAFTTFTAFRSRRSRDRPAALLRLYLELLRLFRKRTAVPAARCRCIAGMPSWPASQRTTGRLEHWEVSDDNGFKCESGFGGFGDMIDLDRLKEALDAYKRDFARHWKNERYKWEAVKHFREHWDPWAGASASDTVISVVRRHVRRTG